MIDESAVIERLKQLTEERQKFTEQMAKLEYQVALYNGAIEDCEYWLAQLQAGRDGNGADDEAG